MSKSAIIYFIIALLITAGIGFQMFSIEHKKEKFCEQHNLKPVGSKSACYKIEDGYYIEKPLERLGKKIYFKQTGDTP